MLRFQFQDQVEILRSELEFANFLQADPAIIVVVSSFGVRFQSFGERFRCLLVFFPQPRSSFRGYSNLSIGRIRLKPFPAILKSGLPFSQPDARRTAVDQYDWMPSQV